MALKGETVNFSHTDHKFGKPSGKKTSFPKTPALNNIRDHATGRKISNAPAPKKPGAKRKKRKKKMRSIRPLAEDKKNASKPPKNGRLLGARILGLRKEVRKLERINRRDLIALKERRKLCRDKTRELFDLMDNTQQLNIPFS